MISYATITDMQIMMFTFALQCRKNTCLQSHEQQDILQARIFAALQGKREHHYLHIGDSSVRNHLASIGG